jgi:hypothetical protein
MALFERMEFAKLLIILDGFDQIMSCPGFTTEFLYLLRSLASDGRLAWVTSSFWKLAEIDQRIGGINNRISPPSNIFKDTVWLGCLSDNDIRAFVDSVEPNGNISVDPADAKSLARIVGPWPYMLERIIDSWLKLRDGNVTVHCSENVLDSLLSLSPWENDFFNYFWSGLEPEEKTYLYSLAHSRRSVQNREIESRLLQYGILENSGNQLRISSLLFEQWIRLDAPIPIELKSSGTHSPQTKKKYENAVFVSYAWGDESEQVVDKLERTFKKHGINLIRDKKDLEYTGSIEEFERRIGQGRCVVLVISDKYLRSKHCMYELMLVNEKRNLRKRVFPIVLSDAYIFDDIKRLQYPKHWADEFTELDKAIKKMDDHTNLDGFINDLKKYKLIRDKFDQLTTLLRDMKASTPEILEKNSFSTLVNAVKKAIG